MYVYYDSRGCELTPTSFRKMDLASPAVGARLGGVNRSLVRGLQCVFAERAAEWNIPVFTCYFRHPFAKYRIFDSPDTHFLLGPATQ